MWWHWIFHHSVFVSQVFLLAVLELSCERIIILPQWENDTQLWFIYVRKVQIMETKSYVKLYLGIPLQSGVQNLVSTGLMLGIKAQCCIEFAASLMKGLTKQVVYSFIITFIIAIFYHSYLYLSASELSQTPLGVFGSSCIFNSYMACGTQITKLQVMFKE